METTPSLACANKCVFCWRHHTNPVGKSWQWKMDDPKEIVKGALDLHTKMIKQMKGVPGLIIIFLACGRYMLINLNLVFDILWVKLGSDETNLDYLLVYETQLHLSRYAC